jgi:glycosyltransferase involved in cell wall biosynthesis
LSLKKFKDCHFKDCPLIGNKMNKKNQIKIGIDARFFGPKQKGLGRYVQKLVEKLEKVDLDNQYVIFLRKENWSEYQPTNPNFQKILADYPWYSLKEQIFLPFKIYQSKVDFVHFPHFNVPLLCFKPFLITIHDLILKRFPTRRASALNPVMYFLKNLAYQLVIFSAVKRAKKIIAVSNYTKRDILKYFKVKKEKVKLIYEGVSLRIVPGTLETISKDVPKEYLLYVGNAYPHKNLERLVLAFNEILRDEKYSNLKLLLVGGMDYFYKRLRKFVLDSASQVQSSVIFTDFVSDRELSVLYQKASLYVFPSLYEGFGLPPLEAMYYQLPVVSSNSSCLPEILGEAAVFFDPENIHEIAEKIKQVLEDKPLQRTLINRGLLVIKKYSWLKMAREIKTVYLN